MRELKKIRKGIQVLALSATLTLSSIFAAPATADLATVLEASRVVPPAQVAFREERYSPLFAQPLLLEGYLDYRGPGVLRKVVESPFEEVFLVEDGEIAIQRDGETRRLPLKRSRALETMLGAIEAILSGEAERLEAVFDSEVSKSESAWSIELKPKSRRISKHLARLRVGGNDASVKRIQIDLRDGEYHVMHIMRQASLP